MRLIAGFLYLMFVFAFIGALIAPFAAVLYNLLGALHG
jgi:hypothetical protein